MKPNYSAWTISADTFDHAWSAAQKLQFFTKYAVLAPSGHNSQPWAFDTNGDTLLLRFDSRRRLNYSGIAANEPYVSLGACLSTLKLAAEGFGYALSADRSPGDSVFAAVRISHQIPADTTLLDAILRRVSNRNLYRVDSLSTELVSHIIGEQQSDVQAYVFTKRVDIERFSNWTEEATQRVMGDVAFRSELSDWVRNNLTRQYDGMPGFTQGIPTPVSLVATYMIKRIDISKSQAKKDSKRVLNSGALAVLAVRDSNEISLTDGGEAYARICVRAQQNRIATSGVAAAILDETTKREITENYGIEGRPIALIRLGVTSKRAKHTPRWPIANVLS